MGKSGGSNRHLHKARNVKDDEFYTLYSTVADEMEYYKERFRGKTVYLPCDDADFSNFYKYFKDNFYELGLAELIASNSGRDAKVVRLTDNGGELVEESTVIGYGDFRSLDVRGLYNDADIIVTNPPFSLFREFINYLYRLGKDYIVMGSNIAIGSLGIWRLYIKGKIRLGGLRGKSTDFKRPDGSIKSVNVSFYTTFDIEDKLGEVEEEYSAEYEGNEWKYRFYDNYKKVINVDKVADIPRDYGGYMGVPVTFLDNYNGEASRFKVYGLMNGTSKGRYVEGVDIIKDLGYDRRAVENKEGASQIDGKQTFLRVLIKKR